MTKEQETAINELQRMKMDKSHTGSEYNAIKTAIQAIKDLDKMNGIALDLASENDDLIEKLDSIRAEIWDLQYGDEEKSMTDEDRAEAYNNAIIQAIEIIDKYRESEEV